MEDSSEPIQAGLYLLQFISSNWAVILVNAFLLFLLIYLSALLTGWKKALKELMEIFPQKELQNTNEKGSAIYLSFILKEKQNLKLTLSLLKTICNIAIALIFVSAGLEITDYNPTASVIILTLVLFGLFGLEDIWVLLLHKRRGSLFSKKTINILKFFYKLLSPVIWVACRLEDMVDASLKRKGYTNVRKDLKKAGIMEETKRSLLQGLYNFENNTVKQVMRFRTDITAFDIETKFHDLIKDINTYGFSRVPVFRETIDQIEGILYLKDLLPYIGREDEFKWQNLLRPAYFVPETKKIEKLLTEFQEKHIHMALVVDEYGGVSGVITLEDILEEIVGDINDELEDADINCLKVAENTFIFEGKTSLSEFTRITGTEPDYFEEIRGENESLGGLLLQINASLPGKGDTIEFKNFVFRIESANNKRIKKVKVYILEETEIKQNVEG